MLNVIYINHKTTLTADAERFADATNEDLWFCYTALWVRVLCVSSCVTPLTSSNLSVFSSSQLAWGFVLFA